MAGSKKKSTTKTTTKTTAAKKKAKPATKAEASRPPIKFNDMDRENQALFLQHLPKIKNLREKLNTANSNLRNAYKSAKAEGAFTKADFDTAIEMEDAEKEARAKARIARTLTIARYMGSELGGQLSLFLEPDRTPAADVAFEEGKRDAMSEKAAKPSYDPSTEQFRKYMEGYHSVSEKRVKGGIKKLNPEVAADQAVTKAVKEKTNKQREEDASIFEKAAPADTSAKEPEPVTSGVPVSRADFLRQQQAEKAAAGGTDTETKH